MKTPIVSVIIPNYNHDSYLDERIQSILNQTYQEFELIILDDCSLDNSLDVIEKYRHHSKVSHVIRNEINSGHVFSQWRKGFELAKGNLIWIAESDDSCDSTLLEKLVKGFVDNENVVLSFCRSRSMDVNGHLHRVLQPEFSDRPFYQSITFMHQYLIWQNIVMNASSAVFRKDVALSIDKGYMELKGVGDWLFWIEIAERGNVYVVNEPLNYFRDHGTNTTSKMRRLGYNSIDVKVIHDYLKDHGHLSWLDSLRFQKKRVCLNKYVYDYYESEEVRRKVLAAWNPNWMVRLWAYVSYCVHYRNKH